MNMRMGGCIWTTLSSGGGTVTGFTTVAPVTPVQTPAGTGAGSRLIYVSSSTGNDGTGNGTIGNPYATAAKGATFIRTGFSDQLLFKCGDVWTGDFISNASTGLFAQAGVAPTILSGNYITGATIQGPILIGSYGTGARPQFRFPIGVGPNSRQGSFMSCQNLTDGNNVAIQGLDFYAYTRDPANGSYVGASTAAADTNTQCIWYAVSNTWSAMTVLIEDCKFNFFCLSAVSFQGGDTLNGGTSPALNPVTVVLRRNIMLNSYGGSAHSQGFFSHGIQNIYYIENFWDHNGWNEDAGLLAQSPGSGATAFNRSVYDGNTGITTLGTVIRVSQGEIHARGSSNSQFRCGCAISDGFFFRNCVGGVDIGENFGTSANVDSHTAQAFTVQRCVVLQSTDIPASNATPGGQLGGSGFFLNNISNATLNNNIVAQCDPTSSNAVAVSWQPTGGSNTVSGNVVTNLIIFKTNTAYTSTIQSSQVDVSSGTNFVDLSGSNTGGAPEPFPHPNPTNTSLVDDYWASLGNAIVNANGVDFLNQCAARAAGTWDRRYSAYGINDYVQVTCFNTSYQS